MRGLLSLLLVGCGAVTPAPVADAGHWWDDTLGHCLPQGVAPSTIGQVVNRINALPHPVSVACVVASLPRPLTLVATMSVFSAQPAIDDHNPRVFIFSNGLVMSVVPAGSGAQLLELGEQVTAGRTLKGEIPFPVKEVLLASVPYAQVLMGNSQTNCALCHRNESPHEAIDGGFVSVAFRPDPGSLMSIAALKAELKTCDPAVDRPRCELLVALVGLGPSTEGRFPSQFELFVQ